MELKTHIANALWTANSNRQGETVQAIASVRREMQEIGLIGPGGGLTRSGSIARERLVNAAQDKAFG